MIVMIDNYDSFTYNLVQEMGKMGAEMEVHRNDAITVEQVQAKQPSAIIISPGPCTPREAGISVDVVVQLAGTFPILGVCLGHQSIIAAYGGDIVHAQRIMHGKTSMIAHRDDPLFANMSNPFIAGRYHSLVGKRDTLPSCLEVIAESEDGEIMAVRHTSLPMYGVQFHPESVLTPEGNQLLKNFLKMYGVLL